ncbi:hypothetical protein KM176_21295 [Pseudooceanicola sp. CBS1P-1]|uniref:5-carboxymethyl-2-hydroxymuconate isomerase n=1 Tax=Pseudooceanicola albus TaxID=2692189 RepID=A0A6L7G8N2_9RHOB|nr:MULTISPECIES: hypothetical protein [Pseudooceanicola]MBT9386417.1 hypothetical protein [Pseudooceanicola endophyticus]MXN20425.1 hypothetical protein [Pseudooceanicola albus]
MPQIVIEHGGLDLDLQPLFQAMVDAIVSHPAVPPEAVKLRAHKADAFLMVSGEPGFLNVTLRLMEGRPVEQHIEMSGLLQDVIAKLLPSQYAVSLETVTMGKASYFKRPAPASA